MASCCYCRNDATQNGPDLMTALAQSILAALHLLAEMDERAIMDLAGDDDLSPQQGAGQ